MANSTDSEVIADKDSGFYNYPSCLDNLIKGVISMSIYTMKIVRSLPPLITTVLLPDGFSIRVTRVT